MDILRIETRLAEVQEAEKRAAVRVKKLEEALEATKVEPAARESDQATQVEAELERLSWKEASSKKCDYCRNAPAKLVEKVRASKGGIKGQSHHFTAAADGPTHLRFKRGEKK